MCWYVYSPMGAITLPCALCKNNAECVRACLCVCVNISQNGGHKMAMLCGMLLLLLMLLLPL